MRAGYRVRYKPHHHLPHARTPLRVVLYEVSSPLRALGTRGWGDKRFRGAVRSRYNPMNVAVRLPTPLTGVTLMLATRPISVAHAIAEAGRREATP